jgi:hypothetical protein
MIYTTVSLFILSVVGIGTLYICKGLGRPIKHSYLLARAFFMILGLAFFLLGRCFLIRSWPYASFFSTLLYILGAQISLWSIGITAEILGNQPHIEEHEGYIEEYIEEHEEYTKEYIEEPSEFNSGQIAMRRSMPILSFVALLAVAIFVIYIGYDLLRPKPHYYPAYGPDLSSIGFIQQVSAETRLPEKPTWVTKTVNSTDRFGKEMVVEIGVLWDPYRWVKGSTEQVSIDDSEKVKFSVGDVIRNFQNTEKRPIIVVGTASHENSVENPELEIGRSQKRADTLVNLCGEHFINHPHLYSLNLGAFRTDRKYSVFSASERRVILLVIKKGEDSLDLTSGVKNALIRAKVEQGFIFDARDYSLFETDRFQVMPRLNF